MPMVAQLLTGNHIGMLEVYQGMTALMTAALLLKLQPDVGITICSAGVCCVSQRQKAFRPGLSLKPQLDF